MKVKEISKEKAITRLLRTNINTRVMKPSYGISWARYIDKIEDDISLKADIYELISTNEKRLEIESIILKQYKDGVNVQVNTKDIEND